MTSWGSAERVAAGEKLPHPPPPAPRPPPLPPRPPPRDLYPERPPPKTPHIPPPPPRALPPIPAPPARPGGPRGGGGRLSAKKTPRLGAVGKGIDVVPPGKANRLGEKPPGPPPRGATTSSSATTPPTRRS